MSAMRRLGDDMRRDPSEFVNRGNARADRADGQDDMVYVESKQGMGMYISREELHEAGAKTVTNYEGRRVIVFPLCHINGEPVYPPVDIEPGEKRRKAEAAINARYNEYREEKKRRGAGGSGGYSRD